jgi:hypothetical protein
MNGCRRKCYSGAAPQVKPGIVLEPGSSLNPGGNLNAGSSYKPDGGWPGTCKRNAPMLKQPVSEKQP